MSFLLLNDKSTPALIFNTDAGIARCQMQQSVISLYGKATFYYDAMLDEKGTLSAILYTEDKILLFSTIVNGVSTYVELFKCYLSQNIYFPHVTNIDNVYYAVFLLHDMHDNQTDLQIMPIGQKSEIDKYTILTINSFEIKQNVKILSFNRNGRDLVISYSLKDDKHTIMEITVSPQTATILSTKQIYESSSPISYYSIINANRSSAYGLLTEGNLVINGRILKENIHSFSLLYDHSEYMLEIEEIWKEESKFTSFTSNDCINWKSKGSTVVARKLVSFKDVFVNSYAYISEDTLKNHTMETTTNILNEIKIFAQKPNNLHSGDIPSNNIPSKYLQNMGRNAIYSPPPQSSFTGPPIYPPSYSSTSKTKNLYTQSNSTAQNRSQFAPSSSKQSSVVLSSDGKAIPITSMNNEPKSVQQGNRIQYKNNSSLGAGSILEKKQIKNEVLKNIQYESSPHDENKIPSFDIENNKTQSLIDFGQRFQKDALNRKE